MVKADEALEAPFASRRRDSIIIIFNVGRNSHLSSGLGACSRR